MYTMKLLVVAFYVPVVCTSDRGTTYRATQPVVPPAPPLLPGADGFVVQVAAVRQSVQQPWQRGDPPLVPTDTNNLDNMKNFCAFGHGRIFDGFGPAPNFGADPGVLEYVASLRMPVNW